MRSALAFPRRAGSGRAIPRTTSHVRPPVRRHFGHFGENELRNRDVRDLDPRRRRAEGHDGSVCCPSGGRARKNRKSSAVQGKNLPTEIEKPEGQIDEGLEQLEAKLFLPKKGDGTLRKRARRGGFAFVASPDTPASCRQSVALSGLAHP